MGCGLMGGGIAQVVAQSGYQTTVVEAERALLDRGLETIARNLDTLVDKGRLPSEQRDATRGRLSGTLKLEDLAHVDLVIEAITENPAIKKETFARLDRICAPQALLASNTSSCTITELAAATKRPAQVLGLDVSAVGNHEFDEGVDELLRIQNGGCHPVDGCPPSHDYEGADFQYLAANVVDKSSGDPILPASTVKTLKVEAPAARSAGIKVKSVAELVEKLKNEAKVI